MSKGSRLVAMVVAAVWANLASATADDASSPTARHFDITRATGEVMVDGVLDEPAWRDALRFDLPYEWSPGDNVAPPVTTTFFTTYDDKHLYAAWQADDPNPDQVRAHLMDRDEIDTLVQDDHVVLMLDTYNDERRGFQFRINPLGVQADALFNSAGGGEDWSFDLIWTSAGRVTETGYVVEIAIPFDQLRFEQSDGAQTWGFDVARSYPRSVRHRIAAHPVDRDNSCVLCQVDKVTGFENLSPGRNLEIVPTATGNVTEARDSFPSGDFETVAEDAELGLSVRWGITPNVSLNATVNPDFSQVEADVAQLAVNNRFALFFPEKRPFFLEGADFFQTPIRAVFTRSVVDPDWGGKATGTFGRNGIGVFVAQDTVRSLLFPSNQRSGGAFFEDDTTTGVVRYRRDVGTGSTVGALYTGRSGDDYSNDVFGADAFLRFDERNTLRLQGLRSETRYPEAVAEAFGQPLDEFSGQAFEVDYSFSGRKWSGGAEWNRIDAGFRADAGFIRRADFEEVDAFLFRRWWGDEDDWYTRADIGIFAERTEDRSGQLTDQESGFWANVGGPLQSFGEITYEESETFFDGVLHDEMRSVRLFGSLQPSGKVRLSLFTRVGDTLDVSNNQVADDLTIEPEIELKVGRHINLRLEHTFQRLDAPAGRLFEVNLTQVRWVYNFNVRMFVRAIFQLFDIERDPARFLEPVEAEERSLFTQLLFSYKLNAQTVLFVGYSDNRLGEEDISLTQADRTVFLKLGYAFTL